MSAVGEMEDIKQVALCCSQCATVNLPYRKYCAKCGAPLWEPCFECGELGEAGERYCGACGADVGADAAEQLERIRNEFRTAEELQASGHFDDAIALLLPITKNNSPRLAEHALQAGQMIRQLAAGRNRQRVESTEAGQLAKQRIDAFDYDGAANIIEQVPTPFRTAEIEQLREEITARCQEIATLTGELHAAVREKRLIDLPPRLERLLTIQPDHVYAKKLTEQVQKHLIAAARKSVAEYDYEQALRLLDQIYPHVRSPQAVELYKQAAELAYLIGDLRNAPVINDTLLAVGERLRRLTPNDGRTMKLCDELRRRSKCAESEQQRGLLSWARAPEPTALGIPVDGIGALRRISCAEAAQKSDLAQYPGRFAVACGLALTGIQQAAIEINLLSTEQRGVLSRVKRLMQAPIGSIRPAWGIDLSVSGLKAVRLVWHEGQKQAVVEAAASIEHAKALNYAANEEEKSKLVADTLKAFLDSQEIKGDRLCASIPGRMALSRQVEFPPVKPSKVAKLVGFEAQRQFPFPLEELDWDFHILDNAPVGPDHVTESTNTETRRSLVIAAKRTMTQQFLGSFQQLSMCVDVLLPDFVALHNFLAYEHFPAAGDPPSSETIPVVAALDVGCDVTNLVVSSPYSFWFHSCGVAGQSFSRALMKELNLGVALAEQLKRNPRSANRLSDFYNALAPAFDDLLKDLQDSLARYAETNPNQPIQRVLGLGGGFPLHGLLRYLRCGR